MNKQSKYDAIIVGGGHNGLVCAFYLARRGLRTCVLERSAQVGGAAITEEFHPGFRNSVASYTVSLLQPKVIEEMRLYEHGLNVVLRKIDNYLPSDDDYLLAGRNGLTEQEIARHCAHDAAAYPHYQAALERVVDCLREFLLVSPPNVGGGLKELLPALKSGRAVNRLGLDGQQDLLAFFTRSAGDILDDYFENDTVKALFGFDAIVGHFASPYEPGSAYVLLHHVFGEAAGVREAWGHAMGGMGAITQAMQRACEAAGVDVFTDSPVEKILLQDNKVCGVALTDRQLMAPIVAASVHPKILYQQLLGSGALSDSFSQRIDKYRSHSGTFRMNVALDGLPQFRNAPDNPDYLTAGIIIAPDLDYMHRAWRSAEQRGWSDCPIVEMLIPSTLDDSLAPAGKHVASLFCQQFAFDLPDGMSWEQQREKVADLIIATVDQHAPGFSDLVVGRQVLSPLDLQQKLALIGGDIFHGKMSLDQLFAARPVLGHGNYRAPIRGLYMCGSGTHPGGGVTGAPGHNAAHAILADRRWWSRRRWPQS